MKDKKEKRKKAKNVRSSLPFLFLVLSSSVSSSRRTLAAALDKKKIEAEIADDAGKAASGEENAGEEGEITSKN